MESAFTQNVHPDNSQVSGACCCPHKMSFKNVLKFLGVVLVVLVLWQFVSSPMVVTVTGIGEVSVPATNATITTTVSVNSDTAQNAISAIAVRTKAITDLLKNSGIPEENISQSQVTSYPAGLVTVGATGYQASSQIVAKTPHVSTVENLIANLYASGASLVQQPVLSVENQKDLEATATDAALKDAKSQVSKIALKNLKLIRKIISLYEQTGSTTSTTTSKADTVTSAQNQLAAQNGVFKITKAVSMSYKLW